jgi:hypothetical protein
MAATDHARGQFLTKDNYAGTVDASLDRVI